MALKSDNSNRFFLSCTYWNCSIILLISIVILNLWKIFSPPSWIRYIFKLEEKKCKALVFDVWVVIMLIIFYIFLNGSKNTSIIAVFFSFYVLFDSVGGTLRDIIESPALNLDPKDGPVISIGNPSRWLLATLLNVILVILSFSILFLYYGNQFEPKVTDSVTALYMSIQTLTTLGYGDIFPVCSIGKKLVFCEILFSLFILTIKIPIAVSVIKSKTRKQIR